MTEPGSDDSEGEPAGEPLDDRVARVIAELAGVERVVVGGLTELALHKRVFARVGAGRVEALLDPPVAAAALRTPDVAAGTERGWVVFTPPPEDHDRYTLDRAEAWLRSAHRRAGIRRD